jgi:hypothetical protein
LPDPCRLYSTLCGFFSWIVRFTLLHALACGPYSSPCFMTYSGALTGDSHGWKYTVTVSSSAASRASAPSTSWWAWT